MNGGRLDVAPNESNLDNDGFQKQICSKEKAEMKKQSRILRENAERQYERVRLQHLRQEQHQTKPKFDFDRYYRHKVQLAERQAKEAASSSKFKCLPLSCRVMCDGKNAKVSNSAILEALVAFCRNKVTEAAEGAEVLTNQVANALAAAVVEVRSYGPKKLVRFKTQEAFEEFCGKKLEIQIKEEEFVSFVFVDDSKPSQPRPVTLTGVFRIHDLDSEIDNKHVLDFFEQVGVQLANRTIMTREYFSNKITGGEQILNGVRRFQGSWLVEDTHTAVQIVGFQELTINNERHQMRIELVGGPRRCYVCGQLGHVGADHHQQRRGATSWAARASGNLNQQGVDDHEEGEIEYAQEDEREEDELTGPSFDHQAGPAPALSLLASNFPVLQSSQDYSNNDTALFAIPSNPAPPANSGALKAGQPPRPSRPATAHNVGGRDTGGLQAGNTTPLNPTASRRSSRTSGASSSASRDASASETKSDNRQAAEKKKQKRKSKSIANHLADANRSGLESSESSPSESAAKKKPSLENDESVNDESVMHT